MYVQKTSNLWVQRVPILYRDDAKVLKLPRTNTENPVLLLEKRLRRCPSFHFHVMGNGSCPKQNSLSSVPSGTTPLWRYQRLALQKDCWLTEFHGKPQMIKHLKPCLHRGLDGAHHSLFCLPRSHQHNVTDIWALLLFIHSNISQKWTLWNFSWFSWWPNFFI